ncbi:hypothetical protein JOB18_023216 [Solea senegalensis]|uniref:Uncharacterized protein n=1 Tax=Solea senegalensis TaxID=28829 RepID=A0AAV6QGJ3_SOLSE|nr:hypothetical protein JOB18_023216 [Solea senegalensis]
MRKLAGSPHQLTALHLSHTDVFRVGLNAPEVHRLLNYDEFSVFYKKRYSIIPNLRKVIKMSTVDFN